MNRQGIWNFWAKYYDRLWLQKISLQPTRALVCEKVMGLQGEAKTTDEISPLEILDIGCGTGQLYGDLAKALGKEQLHYLGIDPSGAMLEQAVAKFPQAAFFQSAVQELIPDQASFDVIVCSHSFPYFSDGEAALEKMASMLKPGGQLLLSQACTNNMYDATVLKLTALATSKAIYRSLQQMTKLGNTLFGELKTFRISKKFFVPSLYLFQWVK